MAGRFRIIDPGPSRLGPAVKVDSFYDRKSRVYITRLLDADGNQIGDAQMSGTKEGRDHCRKVLAAELERATKEGQDNG